MHGRLRQLPLVAATLLLALPGTASAATFTVNSTGDQPDLSGADGACSTIVNTCTLRAAVMQAASAGADTVILPAGTYVTGSALTVAAPNLTISAPAGPQATVLDGPNGSVALDFNGAGASVVSGLAITGAAQGVRVNATELTLDRVVIRGHALSSAGQVNGAGMLITATGKVLMTRSAITGNTATSTSSDAVGGGVRVFPGGEFTAEASTIAGNTAAAPGVGAASFGGGIAASGGTTLALRHVTLANNTAAAGSAARSGGNVYADGGTFTVTDSIITGGQASPTYANCGGSLKPTPSGRNIDSGTTCGFGAGQLSSTDPQLEPLNTAGVLVPKLASPARDTAAACPTGGTDQRGAPAPAGPACDLGAAELGADLAVSVEASRPDAPSGTDVTYVVRVTNNGPDPASAAVLDAALPGASAITLATASAGTCTTAVRCALGTLAPGTAATATITARAGTGGITLNARGSAATPDPVAANDAATLTSPAPPAPGATDTTAPVLSALKLSGKARSGRTATLRATLSEAATVTLKVERLTAGRRTGRRCAVKARRGTPCTIAKTLGTIRVQATAGTPGLKLPATIAKRRLSPGRHRITATATDAAGNRSKPRTVVITVGR